MNAIQKFFGSLQYGPEFAGSLLCAVVGAVVQTILGAYKYTAMVVAVGLMLVLVYGFWRQRRGTFVVDLLTRIRGAFTVRPAVTGGILVAFLTLSLATGKALDLAGILPLHFIDNRVVGPGGIPAAGVIVLLVEDGQTVAEAAMTDGSGYFRFKWLKRKKYKLLIYRQDGRSLYLTSATRDLSCDNGDYREYSFPAERHYILGVYTARYDTASSSLDAASTNVIREAHAMLKSTRSCCIISGNADETGSAQFNMELGKCRALVVGDELVKRGFHHPRAWFVSFGCERPAIAEKSAPAYAANRRAEILVYLEDRCVSTSDGESQLPCDVALSVR